MVKFHAQEIIFIQLLKIKKLPLKSLNLENTVNIAVSTLCIKKANKLICSFIRLLCLDTLIAQAVRVFFLFKIRF